MSNIEQEVLAFRQRMREMFDKKSVDAFLEFVATEPTYDKTPIRENLPKHDRLTQELTLCRAILWSGIASKEAKQWAKQRAKEIREETK